MASLTFEFVLETIETFEMEKKSLLIYILLDSFIMIKFSWCFMKDWCYIGNKTLALASFVLTVPLNSCSTFDKSFGI